MVISEMKMAGGRKLIHDVHNHMFRNHKSNITNCNNNNKYLHIQQSDTEDGDGDINGNETMIHSHNIRITENPLPPPTANAASEDYIR